MKKPKVFYQVKFLSQIFLMLYYVFIMPNKAISQEIALYDGLIDEDLIQLFKHNGVAYSIEGIWLIDQEVEDWSYYLSGNLATHNIGSAKVKVAFILSGEKISMLQSRDATNSSSYQLQSSFVKPTPNNQVYVLNHVPNSKFASLYNVYVKDNYIEYETKFESIRENTGQIAALTVYKCKGIKIAPTEKDLIQNFGAEKKISIPIKGLGDMHYINIEIAGETKSYLIDSGASYITITSSMENRMKELGVLRESDYRGQVELELADDSIVKLKKVIIPALKIGNQTITNVEAVISDNSLLLGRSLINKFKSWNIDNSRNILTAEMY